MGTLSLCMIVKNESKYLTRCLTGSVGFVDEIIIVDTGSHDNTKNIARLFTDRIYDFTWTESFSEARNYSLSKATMDWILVLDADEEIDRDDMASLRKLTTDRNRDGYFLIQRNYTNDTTQPRWVPLAGRMRANYTGYVRNPNIRLFRNWIGVHFSGVVHETVDKSIAPERLSTIEIPIHHYVEEKDLATRQLKYLELCEKSLEQTPDGRLYAIAGAVRLNVKHDAKTALYYFQQAVKHGYQPALCRENVAECHLKLGEYDNALVLYRELANEGYRSVPLLSNLAGLLVQRGDYGEALGYLHEALEIADNPHMCDSLRQYIARTRQLMSRP